MKFSSAIKLSFIATSIVLVACGGDDTQGYGESYQDIGEIRNNNGGGGNNSGANGGTALPANVVVVETAMGTSLSVNGRVTVLTNNGGEGSLSDQLKSSFVLYTTANDDVDKSNCESGCVSTWPPLLAADNDTARPPLSIFDRDDGNKQWALRGLPLYFYSQDASARSINGEGVGGVWRVATDEPTMEATDNTAGVYLAAAGRTLVSTGSGENFVAQERNWHGWTLYTRTADPEGESTCQGECLASWPALLAQEGDENWVSPPYSLINRSLGNNGPAAKQWAYHGKPLYFHLNDGGPGANNSSAAWPLARPISVKAYELAGTGTILTAAGSSLVATLEGGSEVVNAVPSDGMTLYTFANDTANQNSTCNSENCLSAWPALIAPGGAENFADFSTLSRDNNSAKQWAYKGKPLYLNAGNQAPGDTNGVGETWQLVVLNAAPAQAVTIEQLQTDIFDGRCAGCHTGKLDSAENSYNWLLDLDNRLVVDGKPDESRLVHFVEGSDNNGNPVPTPPGRMPQGGAPLSENDIAKIRAWIEQGLRPPSSVANVTIEQLQSDIFSNCAGCHQGNGTDFTSLQATYISLQSRLTPNNGKASGIVHKLQGFDNLNNPVRGRMPEGGKLSAMQVARVINWIDSGAAAPEVEAPAAATLSDVQQLFAAQCANCHTENAAGGVQFNNNSNTRSTLLSANKVVVGDASASSLIQTLESGRMPQGRPRLSDAEIDTVKSWIEAGALDN